MPVRGWSQPLPPKPCAGGDALARKYTDITNKRGIMVVSAFRMRYTVFMLLNEHNQQQYGGNHWKERRIHAGELLVADAELLHGHHGKDQEVRGLAQDHPDRHKPEDK